MACHDSPVLHHVPGVDDELGDVENYEEANNRKERVDSLLFNSGYGLGLKVNKEYPKRLKLTKMITRNWSSLTTMKTLMLV